MPVGRNGNISCKCQPEPQTPPRDPPSAHHGCPNPGGYRKGGDIVIGAGGGGQYKSYKLFVFARPDISESNSLFQIAASRCIAGIQGKP